MLTKLRREFAYKFVRWSMWFGLTFFILLLSISGVMEFAVRKFVQQDIQALPHTRVAVVPGTAKYLSSGYLNPYFSFRIEAAAELYHSGKVEYLLVSGDNSRVEYNEPEAMRLSLIEAGVPSEAIILDYAGFDTYDSMIRAKEVFGQNEFIVVSQDFQNVRAVFIARSFGIQAWGYNAKEVTYRSGLLTKSRELLARLKAVLEILLGVKPTFLGEKILID
jgi:SanA protein